MYIVFIVFSNWLCNYYYKYIKIHIFVITKASSSLEWNFNQRLHCIHYIITVEEISSTTFFSESPIEKAIALKYILKRDNSGRKSHIAWMSNVRMFASYFESGMQMQLLISSVILTLVIIEGDAFFLSARN